MIDHSAGTAEFAMNRTRHDQTEDRGRLTAPLVIIGVAIALIFLPMACGVSMKPDLPAAVLRPL
jgi:hypothetical protein